MTNTLEMLLGIDGAKLRTTIQRELALTRGFPIQPSGYPFHTTTSAFERYLLLEALTHAKGNVSYAGQLLGVDRKTIQRKITSFGMHNIIAKIREGQPGVEPEIAKGVESIVQKAVQSCISLEEMPTALAQRIRYQGIPAVSQETLRQRPYHVPELQVARELFEAGLVSRTVQYTGDKARASQYLGVSVRTINRILAKARAIQSYEARKAA